MYNVVVTAMIMIGAIVMIMILITFILMILVIAVMILVIIIMITILLMMVTTMVTPTTAAILAIRKHLPIAQTLKTQFQNIKGTSYLTSSVFLENSGLY